VSGLTAIGLNGGSVTISNTGAVYGSQYAIVAGGVDVQILNSGTISNGGVGGIRPAPGIQLYNASGTVTNYAGGLIANATGDAIAEYGGGPATITNAGTIAGASARRGVYLGAGGNITNSAGGLINAGSGAIVIKHGLGTVDNAGTLTGNNENGVYLGAGGMVTNGQAARSPATAGWSPKMPRSPSPIPGLSPRRRRRVTASTSQMVARSIISDRSRQRVRSRQRSNLRAAAMSPTRRAGR
jgi:hypothetical protein